MEESTQNTSVLHQLKEENGVNGMFSRNVLIILVVVALLGVGTGYLLANKGASSSLHTITTNTSGSVSKGTVEGTDDLKTFKDIAEGDLKEGGKDGEGQFHLDRPGGDDQTVYITSTLVDLSKYVGKKVKVWGQTQKAQRVGWLMDVGRLEVLQ